MVWIVFCTLIEVIFFFFKFIKENKNHVWNEAKDETSKEILTFDGTGTDHEAQNTASQKLMMN